MNDCINLKEGFNIQTNPLTAIHTTLDLACILHKELQKTNTEKPVATDHSVAFDVFVSESNTYYISLLNAYFLIRYNLSMH